MQIPKPLTHFPNGTFIYKLFDKKYWRVTNIQFNTAKDYYTVRYDNNNEEEITHKEITAYLIPPDKEEYWTEKQPGRRRSKRIRKSNSLKGMQVQYAHSNQYGTTSTNRINKNTNTLLILQSMRKLKGDLSTDI